MALKNFKKKQRNPNANNYVDNEKLLSVLREFKKKAKKAKSEGKARPDIPAYLGEAFLLLATNFSYSKQFINYSYRDEMISDGVENCLMYFENFDTEKYSNPHAYFTKIIEYAFIRRIQKEQKQTYVKYKSIRNSSVILDGHDIDDAEDMHVVQQNSYDNVNEFIRDYERKLLDKKNKKVQKEKDKKGLEKLL